MILFKHNRIQDGKSVRCRNTQLGYVSNNQTKTENIWESKDPFLIVNRAKHQTSKVIREIIWDNGKYANTYDEILGKMCRFYEK